MSKKTEVMAVSDFNLRSLSSEALSAHLAASIKLNTNVAIFGRRGSGKTEISKQQIAKAGYYEAYINTSVLERVDLGGYPNIMGAGAAAEFIKFILPNFYEPMFDTSGKTPPVVALLDEVDKASPDLWAPLLEFTQFRSINGRKIPNLAAVIMTGNLISEGGNRPSLPLLDRAEKFLIQPDVSSWLKWAGASGRIHPSVTAYINDHPNELFGNVDPDDRYADPSPRGWTNASLICSRGEELKISPDILVDKVSGCVGKESGLKYKHYYDHYQHLLPLIDELFKGKDIMKEFKKLEPSRKLVICMIAAARFSARLDAVTAAQKAAAEAGDKKKTKETDLHAKENKWVDEVGNFLSNVEIETAYIALRSQVGHERYSQNELETFKSWGGLLDNINTQINGTPTP